MINPIVRENNEVVLRLIVDLYSPYLTLQKAGPRLAELAKKFNTLNDAVQAAINEDRMVTIPLLVQAFMSKVAAAEDPIAELLGDTLDTLFAQYSDALKVNTGVTTTSPTTPTEAHIPSAFNTNGVYDDVFDELQRLITANIEDFNQAAAVNTSLTDSGVLVNTGAETRRKSRIGSVYLELVKKHAGEEAARTLNCRCCRDFLYEYGGLIWVSKSAMPISVLWNPNRRVKLSVAATAIAEGLRVHVLKQSWRGYQVEHGILGCPETTSPSAERGGAVTTYPHFHINVSEALVLRAKQLVAKFDTESQNYHFWLSKLVSAIYPDGLGKTTFPTYHNWNAAIQFLESIPGGKKFIRADGYEWWAKLAAEFERHPLAQRRSILFASFPSLPWVGILNYGDRASFAVVEGIQAGKTAAAIRRMFDTRCNALTRMRPTREPTAQELKDATEALRSGGYLEALERQLLTHAHAAETFAIRGLWAQPHHEQTPARAPVAEDKTLTPVEQALRRMKLTDAGENAPPPVHTDEVFHYSRRIVAPRVVTVAEFLQFLKTQGDNVRRVVVPTAAGKTGITVVTCPVHADATRIYRWDPEDHDDVPGLTSVAWNTPVSVNKSSGFYGTPRYTILPPEQYGFDKSVMDIINIIPSPARWIVDPVTGTTYEDGAGLQYLFVLKGGHHPRSIHNTVAHQPQEARLGMGLFPEQLIYPLSNTHAIRTVISALDRDLQYPNLDTVDPVLALPLVEGPEAKFVIQVQLMSGEVRSFNLYSPIPL